MEVDDLDRILVVDASLRVLGARRDVREFGSSSGVVNVDWEGKVWLSDNLLERITDRGGGESEVMVIPSGSKCVCAAVDGFSTSLSVLGDANE